MHPYYANVKAATSRTFCCQGWNSLTPATKCFSPWASSSGFSCYWNAFRQSFPLSPVFLNHHGNLNPSKKDLLLHILSSLCQLILQGQVLRNLFQAKLLLLVHLAPLLQIKVLNTFMPLSSAVFLSANYVTGYDACISIASVLSIYTTRTTTLSSYLFIMTMSLSSVHN